MPVDPKKSGTNALEGVLLPRLEILKKMWQWLSSGSPLIRIALWLSLLFIPFAWLVLLIFGLGAISYHPGYYTYTTILQNFIYYYGPLVFVVLGLTWPRQTTTGSRLLATLIILPALAVALMLYTTVNIFTSTDSHLARLPDLSDSLNMSQDYYLCPLPPILAHTTTLPNPILEIAEDGRVIYSRTGIDWRHLKDQRQQTLYANLEQAVQQQRLNLALCHKHTWVQPQIGT